VREGKSRERAGEIRVQLQRPAQQALCRLGITGSEARAVPESAVIALPRGQVFRRFEAGALHFRAFDLRFHDGDDRAGDVVLYREQIIEQAVEALRPHLFVSRGIDQRDGHSQTLADSLRHSVDQVAHAK